MTKNRTGGNRMNAAAKKINEALEKNNKILEDNLKKIKKDDPKFGEEIEQKEVEDSPKITTTKKDKKKKPKVAVEKPKKKEYKSAIEKLKDEFKKADYMSKIIINNCLLPELKNNEDFEQRILLDNKTVKDMFRSINNWVRKSKNHAPSHDIIFSLAIHYYLEDNPEYVEELLQEEDLEFGNILKEFNTPVVKYITGTVIKETIKEVIKNDSSKKKRSTKKQMTKKVKKTVKNKLKDIGQISLFEE